MLNGLSTNRWCHPSASCIAAAGKQFIVRYYSRTTSMKEKVLRPEEARQLAVAGIDLAVVYQDRGRAESDFGADRGELDARTALEQAANVGQPPGSAIYFAVDVDFSKVQIRKFVLPYFGAIKRVFAQETSLYTIGVYGSGLTCRLLEEAANLITYTWLAEATGWRESATYANWAMKQQVNHASLCGLGPSWEHCDAKPEFGQFRPLGSSPLSGSAVDRVVGDELPVKLLSMPNAGAPTVLGLLPYGTPLKILGEAGHKWVRVALALGDGKVSGYLKAASLKKRSPDTDLLDALVLPEIPAVHLAQDNRAAARANAGAHAYPLGELRLPFRDPDASSAAKAAALQSIADWMNVEHSPRYLPTGPTYCNVYAADYCFLARVYLPRVWWNARALIAFTRGENPPPVYGRTLKEMRADDLHDWLLDFGPQFGWRRTADLTAMQATVNAGGVGVICADREAEGRSGHITLVVPELAGRHAVRDADGTVQQPLQSQAGKRNRRYGNAGSDWWLGQQFRSFVMFIHA